MVFSRRNSRRYFAVQPNWCATQIDTDSDAASLRARHRRQAQAIAARMSQTTLQVTCAREPDSSSQPSTSRRSGSPEICRSCCCCSCSCISSPRGRSVSRNNGIDTMYMNNSEEDICSSDLPTCVHDTLAKLTTSARPVYYYESKATVPPPR